MRTSTFAVSFLVHALLIAGAIVVRVTATDVLPEPPRATAFVLVTPEMPEVPPPIAAQRRAPSTRSASTSAAVPIAEPPALVADPPRVVDEAAPTLDALADGQALGGSTIAGGDIAPPSGDPVVIPQPPIRVGGDVRAPEKVRHVAPVYPAIARAAGVTGIVILEAVVGEDGMVRDLRVLRSVPLLDAAAVDAVRQWRFTPTRLNGDAVPVIMTVTVAFTLR